MSPTTTQPSSLPGHSQPGQQPNLVLVCVDQMRFDAMGCAGNEHIDTPYLDALARRGNRFTRAYSSTPTCIPARVGMLTGTGPETHGRYGYRERINFPDAYPTTLPGTLREHGYQTYGVGKMHVWPERARCGFDDVQLHDGYLHVSRAEHRGASARADDYLPWLRAQTGDPAADYQDTGLGCNSMVARPWEREERLHPTRWVADTSFDFLTRRDPTRPFFLYMSFHRPHAPFDPPGWLWDKYSRREMPERPMGDWVEEFDGFRREGDDEAEFAHRSRPRHDAVKAGYYGSIEFIDFQVNRLLETLHDQGVAENTAILFVSDHGEMLGDHDLYRKSVAYEGSSHIPFLLHLPPRLRKEWGPAGDVDAIVELRDVMPTLLDLAGVPIPAPVTGTSLRRTVRDGAPVRGHLQGEHLVHQLGRHSMQWILSERHKYVWFSGDGREQLFDLVQDPYECVDLVAAGGHTSELARHRELLIGHLEDREEGFVHDGALVPGRPLRSEAEWVRQFAAD